MICLWHDLGTEKPKTEFDIGPLSQQANGMRSWSVPTVPKLGQKKGRVTSADGDGRAEMALGLDSVRMVCENEPGVQWVCTVALQ